MLLRFPCCFPTFWQSATTDEGLPTEQHTLERSTICWGGTLSQSLHSKQAAITPSLQYPLVPPSSRDTQTANNPSKPWDLQCVRKWIVDAFHRRSHHLSPGANTGDSPNPDTLPVVVMGCDRPYPPGLRDASFSVKVSGERQMYSIREILEDPMLKTAVIAWNSDYESNIQQLEAAG